MITRRAPIGPGWLVLGDEVAAALDAGRPVVALESSLIAHGLPTPHNLETALAAESAVRGEGAVPATVALDAGQLLVGAPRALLERLADARERVAKAGSGDLGPLLAARSLAATTVSATIRAAYLAGIALLATGGIGGVHRRAIGGDPPDVSADIDELAATPVAVVCSGPKAILDLPATLELLESRRVPVVGLAVDELPAFYATTSGLRLEHSVGDARAAAATIATHLAISGGGGLLIVQPPPAEVAIAAEELEGWVAAALAEAARQGLRRGDVTPFVLDRIASASGGRSVEANVALIVNNARLAARIATALASA